MNMPTLDPVALAALPIGTSNAQAFSRNASDLDAVINGTSTVPTRTGKSLLSIDEAMRRIGYEVPVAFNSGLSITRATQTVTNGGQVYHANPASVPFTTTGTFNAAQWLLVSGVSKSAFDAAAVGYATSLASLRTKLKTEIQRIAVDASGIWQYDAADTTSVDNGVTVIVASDGGRWKLTTGDVGPILTATEGVTFANGYRSAASGSLTVPTSNPGHVRYWTANYGLTVPPGATIPPTDVRHDHVALSARSRTSSVGSRIWGAVTLAHNDSPATSNADIGQCFGLEVDVNNKTGYPVTNLSADGDIGGIIVASGGSSASKFGICVSKLSSAQGFYTGLWFRENVLHPSGFGIYFGNVSPSVGIRFGDDYTGGPAMQTLPGQDALSMRTTSGPFARIRSRIDRLEINCGNGGRWTANADNTETLESLENNGLWRSKGQALGFGVILVTSTAATFDASGGSRYQVQLGLATTVTGFTTMGEGQIIRLLAMNGNLTLQHNGGLQLAGGVNYTMSAGSIITLERWGSVIREIGRTVA